MGFVINRLDVAITGMEASSGVSYVPSWMELSVTLCIVAVGFVLFGLAGKYLPVFPEEGHEATLARVELPAASRARPAFTSGVLVALWGLALAGCAAVTFSMKSGSEPAKPVEATAMLPESATPLRLPASAPDPGAVASRKESRPDVTLKVPEDFTIPMAKDSPGAVRFSHQMHVDGANCATCHRTLFRITEPGKPIHGNWSMELMDKGQQCGACHDGQKAFASDGDCTMCHQE